MILAVLYKCSLKQLLHLYFTLLQRATHLRLEHLVKVCSSAHLCSLADAKPLSVCLYAHLDNGDRPQPKLTGHIDGDHLMHHRQAPAGPALTWLDHLLPWNAV